VFYLLFRAQDVTLQQQRIFRSVRKNLSILKFCAVNETQKPILVYRRVLQVESLRYISKKVSLSQPGTHESSSPP